MEMHLYKGASGKYLLKGMDTYAMFLFQFFIFYKFTKLMKILFLLYHYGVYHNWCRLMWKKVI